MERKRLTLDNPVFKGNVRYKTRRVTYVKRPLQTATISDVLVARAPKPKPKHAVNAASRLHAPRLKPAAPKQSTRPSTPKIAKKTSRKSVMRAHPHHLSGQQLLYAMAVIVFLCGMVVSLTGLKANHQVAAQVKQSQHTTEATVASSDSAPSTVKPSAAAVRNYSVSPNLPRYIDIPKLSIHTRTLSEGVDKKGELQVPWNIYDTGWYNASSQPGQNGAMLVDGHSGIGNMHGVFYKLATLSIGDPIIVTRGDGQKFTYLVNKVQTVGMHDVDMSSMLVSANTAKPGLNLITCTGDRIAGTNELNKRVLVYAVQQ